MSFTLSRSYDYLRKATGRKIYKGLTLTKSGKMVEVIIDVPPREPGIVSAICRVPFNEAYFALKRKGFPIILLNGDRGNVALRMQEGKDSSVSRNGNYTGEGVLYRPREEPELVRWSPILKRPEMATDAHRIGQEFYPSKAEIERALGDSVKIPYGIRFIPTNRFNEDEVAAPVFGEQAEAYGNFLREARITEAYGNFLREARIKEMPVHLVGESYVKEQKKPFVRQLWFGGLVFGSCLGGGLGSLPCGVRGVSKKTGESSPRAKLLYTPRQVSRAKKTVQGVRIRELAVSELETVVEFLDSLDVKR